MREGNGGREPVPVERGRVRLTLGSAYFRCKRYAQWYLDGTRYASERLPRDEGAERFPHIVVEHRTPLFRDLAGIEHWLQANKVHNLRLAVQRLDGLRLQPGETLSVWKLVGRPSKRRGYLPGMILVNGEIRTGYGGGLCQLSNLLYWMTVHTELTVTERYRHQYDVFPDANRTLPFGSGATIAYNYIDLQIRNDADEEYYLRLDVTDSHLVGAWCCRLPARFQYEIIERHHRITQHPSGKYIRHNQLWRRRWDLSSGTLVDDTLLVENHALMMYSPLLPSGTEGSAPHAAGPSEQETATTNYPLFM